MAVGFATSPARGHRLIVRQVHKSTRFPPLLNRPLTAATAECPDPGSCESGGGLRCQVVVEEIRRNRRMQLGENGFPTWPVLVQHRGHLADRGDPQRVLTVSVAGKRLQL